MFGYPTQSISAHKGPLWVEQCADTQSRIRIRSASAAGLSASASASALDAYLCIRIRIAYFRIRFYIRCLLYEFLLAACFSLSSEFSSEFLLYLILNQLLLFVYDTTTLFYYHF